MSSPLSRDPSGSGLRQTGKVWSTGLYGSLLMLYLFKKAQEDSHFYVCPSGILPRH